MSTTNTNPRKLTRKARRQAQAVADYLAKVRRALACAEAADAARAILPHVGQYNRKTATVTEGTTPGATCAACAMSGRTPCIGTCYGRTREDGLYPLVRQYHAENTIMRRRDPLAYYMPFFAAADQTPAKFLRLNETGDFETVRDLHAVAAACAAYPAVRVLAYSRRYNLIDAARDILPPAVRVVWSAFNDPAAAALLARRGVPYSRVVARDAAGTCPAIARARANKARKAAGLPELKPWTCAMCAARRCGCWSAAVVEFPKH